MKPKKIKAYSVSDVKRILNRLKNSLKQISFKDKLGEYTYDTLRTNNAIGEIDEEINLLVERRR